MKRLALLSLLLLTTGCAAKRSKVELGIPVRCIVGATVKSVCIPMDGGLALCHEVLVKHECVEVIKVPATNPVKTDGQTKRRRDEGQPK